VLPNDFESALFTVTDYGEGTPFQDAVLVLVDQDLGCDDLLWDGDLDVWSLPGEVAWVRTYVRRGIALDGWLRDIASMARAQQSGSSVGDDVSWFWGEVGLGPVLDDVPDVPPGQGDPETDGRDVTAMLGFDEGLDDILGVTLSTDALLAGSLDTWAGEWSFAATKCDVISETGDGTEPDDPPEDDEGEDDGQGSGSSGGSAGAP
jgi:hypothetical protein